MQVIKSSAKMRYGEIFPMFRRRIGIRLLSQGFTQETPHFYSTLAKPDKMFKEYKYRL